MPYKDIKKRNKKQRERGKKKVKTICCICGKDAFVRKDTLYKCKNNTCSKKCKSIFLKNMKETKINNKSFIQEYLKFNCGFQSLCKKYHIGNVRGKEILEKNDIKIKTSYEIKKIMREKGVGNWKKAENRFCMKCGKKFKYKKKSTVGRFCSVYCYMRYKGKTQIEEITENILNKFKIKNIYQFKLNNSFFDFYLPKYNILIECDGTYWHSFPDTIKRDNKKTKMAKKEGYFLIRFSEKEILEEQIEGKILNILKRGIEMTEEYIPIAEARIKAHVPTQQKLEGRE